MIQEKLIEAARAVDALVGSVPNMTEGMGLHGSSFEQDMRDALSGEPGVPFTVRDVLSAMHNWSVMAARRAGVSVDG